MFQYPFILLAGDWPTQSFSQIRFHIDPAISPQTVIDTVPYERYLAQICALTGLNLQRPIDYYLCRDSATSVELLGMDDRSWGRIGPCVITFEPFEFAEITRVVLAQAPPPFDFLSQGIVGYGELERAALDTRPFMVGNTNCTLDKYLSQVTPDTLDMLLNWSVIRSGLTAPPLAILQFYIGAAFVSELADLKDAATFRQLYDRSRDAETFTAATEDLYGMTPQELLEELTAKYDSLCDEAMSQRTRPKSE